MKCKGKKFAVPVKMFTTLKIPFQQHTQTDEYCICTTRPTRPEKCLGLQQKNHIHRIQNHVEMFVNLIVWITKDSIFYLLNHNFCLNFLSYPCEESVWCFYANCVLKRQGGLDFRPNRIICFRMECIVHNNWILIQLWLRQSLSYPF